VAIVAEKLNLPNVARSRPPLSIPGKLIVPSFLNDKSYAMLGLGDIVSQNQLLNILQLFTTSLNLRSFLAYCCVLRCDLTESLSQLYSPALV